MAERLCFLLPDTMTTEYAKSAMDAIEDTSLDDVKVAVAALVRNRTAWQGVMLPRVGVLGGAQGKGAGKVDSLYDAKNLREKIGRVAAAMAGRLTALEEDFATVIEKHDQPGTLLLLDPPYFDLGDQLYLKTFTIADHERLAACVHGLKHAHWAMTNGMDELTYSLYGDGKATVMPLRVHGAHGSRLERMIAPKKTRFAEHPIGLLQPITTSQLSADMRAARELGPEVLMTAGRGRGVQPSKGRKARAGKLEVPVAEPLTDKEKKLLVDIEKAMKVDICCMFSSFVRVGNNLRYIDRAELYRESHGTFAEYCDDRWHISRGRAYQLMRAAQVVETIQLEFRPGVGRVLADGIAEGLIPANEAQVRSLAPLLGEDDKAGVKAVCAVWRRVLKRAAAGEPLTAALVADEVTKWRSEHGEEPRAPVDDGTKPLGNLHPLELRIRRATDVKALDSAMAQLRELLKLLEGQRAQLAAVIPQESAPV